MSTEQQPKQEKIYAKGVWANKPHVKAPEWIKMNLKFSAKDFNDFFNEHVDADGNLRLSVMDGRDGYYIVLDNYKPKT